MRYALLALLVLVVPLAAPIVLGSHTAPEPGVLYLRPAADGGRIHNFTTHRPDVGAEARMLEMRTTLNRSLIDWSTPSVPSGWTSRVGDTVTLDVWIAGLDAVVAAAEPDSAARRPGQVVVQARLEHGGEVAGSFASGETGVDVSPTAPDPAPRQVTITMPIQREVTFANDTQAGETFRLDLIVSGHNRPETPLIVHVLSPDTPSRLVVPGFPVAAFRAWEDAERAAAACQERQLEGEACETPTPTDDPDDGGDATRQTALPWLIGLAAILVVVTVVLFRGRR